MKNHFIPFIALTETWLSSHIADAQVSIPSYTVSRSDRSGRGGGVILFSHEKFPITTTTRYDDGVCQALLCQFHSLKINVIVVYRPPDAAKELFSRAIGWIRRSISEISDDSYQLILVGDFNFPYIDWNSYIVQKTVGLLMQQSADEFLNLLSDHYLNQYVLHPTRSNNILDLFATNNPYLVTNVSISDIGLSDHKMVDVMLYLDVEAKDHDLRLPSPDCCFRTLDFVKANFDIISREIVQVPWGELMEDCLFEDFPVLLTLIILQICLEYVPIKKMRAGKPRLLNALRRKKKRVVKKLESLKLRNGNANQIQTLETKLALITFEVKETIMNDLDSRERSVVKKIKVNPKVFYSYAKSHARVKSNLAMLISDNGEVVMDEEGMANTLQRQFSSVYSDPLAAEVRLPHFASRPILYQMSEDLFTISNQDILSAIADIKTHSAAGPDELPAVLLKRCAESLIVPIKYLWQESFNRGIVPQFYKRSHVCPLFKKGDRARPENYRPVSMTSHVIKVYERIIRKIIVQYIELNQLLTHNQHGFRSGRSTLTQLLAHYDEICEGLRSDMDTDSIYLDYSKAFDKVDHRLLLCKLSKYDFHPMLINWIKSFLTGRSQEVVINGKHSMNSKIISGVPQGTVLGPVLFIIFINDLEQQVQHSNIRFFADDTRISKQISLQSHSHELQEDLEAVMRWSKENNMALHDKKFELVIHRANPDLLIHELPFSTDLWTYKVSEGLELLPVNVGAFVPKAFVQIPTLALVSPVTGLGLHILVS